MLSLTTFLICLLFTTLAVVGKGSDDNEGASLRSLSQDERRMAKEAGYSYVDRLTQLEEDLYAQGFHVKEGTPMSMMAKFKRPSQDVIDLSRTNMRFVETVRYLKNDLGLKEKEIERSIGDGELDTGCLSNPVCPSGQDYRTIDGSCNHRETQRKNLGRAVSGYRRLLQPAYNDGVSSPRSIGSTGAILPSARLVSMNVFSDSDRPFSNITSLLMQFGQFINHDLESTSQFTFPNGVGFSCCAQNNMPLDPSVLDSLVHCLPITIPIGDRQLFNSENRCMNFVRSSTGPNRISCDLPFVSYAEQYNQNTHWLDASTVYGSNINTTTLLRNASNGMLNTFIDSFGHSLLPINSSCLGCLFTAGDSRVNEQPQLTVIQTIWMREHNRVAKYLTSLNPTWSRETVFQEARRIVIAELQHITYNEFLPALLGSSGMQKYDALWPLPGKKTFHVNKSFNNKKETTNSGPISNEFATAAFRMGHSLVQGNVQLVDTNGQVTSYSMMNFFNNPNIPFDPFFYDNTIRGLVTQLSQKIDNQVTDDLWLQLFQNLPTGYGGQINIGILDIVALNIQRGRDHGLPNYNKYRQMCGLPKLVGPISSLPTTKPNDTISPYFDPWVVNALNQVYQSVDDIDLYVGGLVEINQLEDGLLGPTFACIIAENFLEVKYEDRYFYEAGPGTNPNPFTNGQLIEIKKSSMARIFCDNNDGSVSNIQPNTFLVPSAKNPMVDCKSGGIPSLNLDLWKVRR